MVVVEVPAQIVVDIGLDGKCNNSVAALGKVKAVGFSHAI